LQRRYAGRVEFGWRIAQMPAEAYPVSVAQAEWFYRRSGFIMQSPIQLNAGWLEPGRAIYDAPNLVAEAAKDFGVTDDRVRLALANAAEREGKKVGRWEVAVPIAAAAAQLDESKLLAAAQSAAVSARVNKSTDEFHATSGVLAGKCHRRPRGVLRPRARGAAGGSFGRAAGRSSGLRKLSCAVRQSADGVSPPNSAMLVLARTFNLSTDETRSGV
jgi:hypothetical protein